MTRTVILLLIAISTVNSSSDCDFFTKMFNLNPTNGEIEIKTTVTSPVTTPDTVPSGIIVKTNQSNTVSEINHFAKLYRTLRTYHENELRKVQSRYEQLEEYVKNELDEIQRKYYLLEAKMRKSESSNLKPVCTCCESDSLSSYNLNSSHDSTVLHKVEQIDQRISTLTDGNVQLLHKIEQVYEILSNVTDVTNISTIISNVGPQNCSTNSSKNKEDIMETTAPTIEARINNTGNKRTHKKYLGCYQDRQEHRLLKEFMKHNKSNSVDTCVDTCLTENYVFAGIEG